MKIPWRRFLLAGGALALMAAALAGLALTPAVQTWAVRRALADVPGVTLDRAAIGLHSVHLENLRVTRPSFALVLPAADIKLSVIAAVRGRVQISRLTAKGWTLDLTPAATSTTAAKPPSTLFDGIFKSLRLPFALTVGSAELEGDVTHGGDHAQVALTGGGLGQDREGNFKITLGQKSTGSEPVSALVVTAELTARMDAPDSIQRFALTADATATGAMFPHGTSAHLTFWAGRDASGESYTAIIRSAGHELVNVEARLPVGEAPLTGKWSLDATDSDLAPITMMLGYPLPEFQATGQGTLSAGRDFKEITAVGKLSGSTGKLEALRPGLAAMGRVEFATDFDLMQRGDVTRVEKLNVRLGGAQPFVTVETLQGFEFDRATHEMKVANPASDLARVDVQAVPLAWAQPFLPPTMTVAGVLRHGRLVASARDQGFVLALSGLDLTGTLSNQSGVLWQGQAGAASVIAHCSPDGWRAGIALGLDVTGLTATTTASQPLPVVALDAHADIGADGSITLAAPISVTQGGQESDLMLHSSFAPARAGWQIDAQVAGDTLYLADLAAFTHLPPIAVGAPPTSVAVRPSWTGVTGAVTLAFKNIVVSPSWQGSLEGKVKFAQDTVTLDSHGMLGGGAPFTLIGGVTDTAGGTEPYALTADVTLKNFDTTPLRMSALEGRVDLVAQLTGHAASPGTLADHIQGRVQLTSRQGVTHILAVTDDTSGLVESAAGQAASALGTVVGVVAGGGKGSDAAAAVNQIAGLLHEIRYDQLNVTLTRNAARDLVLEDLTLISPQVRLAGHGRVRGAEWGRLSDQPLALQLQVAASGPLGTVMRVAGLVTATPDDLGYLPLALELPELGGTLRAPDTGAFYRALTERAVAKGAAAITTGAVQGVKAIPGGIENGAGALLHGLFGP